MSITIRQIAEHTGLSIPTVGNVLGRSAARYSSKTRERVLQAVQELGYKPNSSARAMRRGRSGSAAFVLSRSRQDTHSHIPIGLLDGLDDELALHDMHLTVFRLNDDELAGDDFVPKCLREDLGDGIIVNRTHDIPPRMLEMIRAHHAPAVWVNAKLPEDCVYPDDRNAARDATKHLIGLGHRRIALLHLIAPLWHSTFEQSRPFFHYSVADRVGGYVAAMRDAGLPPLLWHDDRFIAEADQMAACRRLLEGPDRPTAVLVYSSHDLPQLMCAASALGLSVPKDLSVLVFFPNEPWSGGVRVSAAQIPTVEVGRRAVRMMLKKMSSPDELCPAEAVPYTVVPGASIAPPQT